MLPRASRAVAVSWRVAVTPSGTTEGDTPTLENVCNTEVPFVPDTVPLVAVIVALPLLTAVAVVDSPVVGLTETTPGGVEAQVTVASPMVAFTESLTTADSVRVSPKDAMASTDDMATETAAGARTGAGGVPPSPPPPQALRKIAAIAVAEIDSRIL